MALTATENGGKTREPVPEGLHAAVCTRIVDFGNQTNEKYGKVQHLVLICFEIPAIRIDFERGGETKNMPVMISKRYTVSLNEKSNLRKDLQTWRGKSFTDQELQGFHLKNVLGVPCRIQILHNTGTNGKIYDNINAIMPADDGNRSKAEGDLEFFEIEDSDQPIQIPEWMPQWCAGIITESREWKARGGSNPHDLRPTETSESAADQVAQARAAAEEKLENLPF